MSKRLMARREGQTLLIAGGVRVTVEEINHTGVVLSVEASSKISVDREEIYKYHQRKNEMTRAGKQFDCYRSGNVV